MRRFPGFRRAGDRSGGALIGFRNFPRGWCFAKHGPAVAHKILEPLGCKTKRGHLTFIGAITTRIPGELRLQYVINPLFDFLQLGLTPRALDLAAEFIESGSSMLLGPAPESTKRHAAKTTEINDPISNDP